ncbi:MAG: U32 family peptidase C-terminal domain-containing protein [Desulfuromonadales bacterium]|nr:U32 family peptidase C-terminal domain-containing protein [Desulfuromonadales bacterium]
MIIPELLAPAGNLEKLEASLAYGADAVYLGIDRFSLRAGSGCLSLPELGQACDLAGHYGRRLYLTLNAFLRPGEEADFRRLLVELRPLPIDAYIIADPGALALVRAVDPDRALHLSTQANVTSAGAAQFWQALGVKRLNLARELTLEEIRAIRAQVSLELEVFVHGALCVAYSGRCLLSAAMTGRSANRGKCAHPCRWNYAVQEETRPGESFRIEEDARGTYLFNSRDLRLIEHLPQLVAAGIDSLKIEGRMKSRYYVAAVTRVYRAALDAFRIDPAGWRVDPLWLQELETVSHRPYDSGFLFSNENAGVHPEDSRYRQSHLFVGAVLDDGGPGGWLVEGRNRFAVGEELELIGPGMRQACFRLEGARSEAGEALTVIQPNARVYLDLPGGAKAGDLLRKRRE